MKVITWKLQKGRVLGVLFLLAALAALTFLVVFLPELSDKQAADGAKNAACDEASRKAFFAAYGWKVADTPLEIKETELSPTPKKDFLRMQKEAGLDPLPHKGRRVKAYTYGVLNHPTGRGDVTATVFVYEGKAVAGYLSLADGLQHSLAWKGEPMSAEETTVTAAAEEACPID